MKSRRTGGVVVALQADEINLIRSDPRLTLVVRDNIQGLDNEKGKMVKLQLTVIRPGEPAVTFSPEAPIAK